MTSDRASATRAVLLGLVAAVLGVAAHDGAGGTVTTSPAAAAVAGLVVLATALTGARPRPAAALAGVLAGGQLALHLALGSAPGAGMEHHAHHGTAPDDGSGMVLAHLAVAVLVAGGFAHADRALLDVARDGAGRIAAWARRLAGPPPAIAATSPRPGRRTVSARPRRAAVGHHPRRGPPSPHRTGSAAAPMPAPAPTTPRPGRKSSCPHRGRRPPDPARPEAGRACSPSC